MKSTWSTGSISHTQASLSNEMWKIPVGGRSSGTVPRPPPGLTNNKHNNSWTPGPLSNSWSRDYSSGLSSLPFLSSFLSFLLLPFPFLLCFPVSSLCFSFFRRPVTLPIVLYFSWYPFLPLLFSDFFFSCIIHFHLSSILSIPLLNHFLHPVSTSPSLFPFSFASFLTI